MAVTLRIKRRSTGNAGAPAALKNAELAYNEVDDILYYGKGADGNDDATSIVSIAGPGQYVDKTSTQTISGNKTFTATVDLGSGAVAATPATNDDSTAVATTAFVKDQAYITGNETITLSGDATGSGETAITVTLADVATAGTATKLTFNSKGLVTSGTTLDATDIPTLTAAKISDFDTQVQTNRLDQLAAPTAAVALNGQNLTGLADPVNAQDAATKAYVDAAALGLDVKESVVALSDSNITLSGEQTVDGIALVAGDRILVTGQTDATQNGIYVVAAGAWGRSTDADNTPGNEVSGGMFTFVEQGTTYGDSGWVLTTNGPITLGTDELVFTQFSGTGQITAGAGLTKTGNTIDVVGTTDRISVGANSIDIASTYVGQVSIDTLGTIGTGTWQADAITEVYGGTGITTYATGDVLYADAADSLAVLAKPATEASIFSMNTAGVPSYLALSNTGITGLGTVTTGVWNATVISLTYGGTGADLSGDADGTIYKKSGSALVAATAGQDYLDSNSLVDGGNF
jgi:hypothetical protein